MAPIAKLLTLADGVTKPGELNIVSERIYIIFVRSDELHCLLYSADLCFE